MSGRQRSRRAPLIALLVAATAAVGVSAVFDIIPTALAAPQAPRPAVDGTGTVLGQRLTLESAIFDAPGTTAPEGARTLEVRLAADPVDPADDCGPMTLTEATGAGREWGELTSDALEEYSTAPTRCDGGEEGPYEILVVFIVPKDAAGPFHLDVGAALGGDRLRFELTP